MSWFTGLDRASWANVLEGPTRELPECPSQAGLAIYAAVLRGGKQHGFALSWDVNLSQIASTVRQQLLIDPSDTA